MLACNPADLLSRVHVAEKIVRTIATYAESGGDVILALWDVSLADDYQRIKESQHQEDAFGNPVEDPGPFAWLPFSHTELELLRECVQDQLAERLMYEQRWGQLNALRTALAEAMYGLERLHPASHD